MGPVRSREPPIERFARTRDTRPYRFSDVVSADELHALAQHVQLQQPEEFCDQFQQASVNGPSRCAASLPAYADSGTP